MHSHELVWFDQRQPQRLLWLLLMNSQFITVWCSQFDAWQDAVSISWAGELLFSLGCQSSRDDASIKILGPITIPAWHQEGHLIIKSSQNWIYEMTKYTKEPNYLNGSGTFQGEDVMHSRTSVRCRQSQTVIQ